MQTMFAPAKSRYLKTRMGPTCRLIILKIPQGEPAPPAHPTAGAGQLYRLRTIRPRKWRIGWPNLQNGQTPKDLWP